MKIIAKGKRNNESVVVTAEKTEDFWDIVVDKPEHYFDFLYELRSRHPVGGTFYPEEGTGLYILAAIYGTWFFDDTNTEIETWDFEEEIPAEEGIIY